MNCTYHWIALGLSMTLNALIVIDVASGRLVPAPGTERYVYLKDIYGCWRHRRVHDSPTGPFCKTWLSGPVFLEPEGRAYGACYSQWRYAEGWSKPLSRPEDEP